MERFKKIVHFLYNMKGAIAILLGLGFSIALLVFAYFNENSLTVHLIKWIGFFASLLIPTVLWILKKIRERGAKE